MPKQSPIKINSLFYMNVDSLESELVTENQTYRYKQYCLELKYYRDSTPGAYLKDDPDNYFKTLYEGSIQCVEQSEKADYDNNF